MSSKLDYPQIIQDVHDESGQTLRVSIVSGGGGGSTTTTVDNAAGAAAVNIQDGGNSITVDSVNLDIRDLTFAADKVDASGSSVSVSSSALPTGAATEVTLASIDGKVPANLTVSSTRLLVDGSGVTQPVSDGGGSLTVDGSISVSNFPATQPISAVSLPLPTGASTSALQTSSEAILTTIDADTSALAGTVSGTELQVDIVASLPAGTNNIGDVDVVSSVLPTGASTSALQTSSEALLTTIDADTSALAGTVLGSELQVDVVSSALPSGAATSALQTTGNSSLSSIDGKIPAGLTVTATRLLVDGSGVTQPVSDGGGSLTVDGAVTVSGTATVSATDLDIRDLTSVSDSVSAVQSGAWVLGANSGVDIGDVTVNNAAGAAAVNIQDGGNSITVDGTVAVSGTVATTESYLSVQSKNQTYSAGWSGGFLNTAITNIPGSASSSLEVIASLAATVKKWKIADTTGFHISFRVGATNGTEEFIINPGMDYVLEHTVVSGSRISIRAIGTAAIFDGELVIEPLY